MGTTGAFGMGGESTKLGGGVSSSLGEPWWEFMGEVELQEAKPSSFQSGDIHPLSSACGDTE